MTAEPHPEGNPALAAATEAILNRRLAATHSSGQGEARRAAILLEALPDAAAAVEAAAPHIAAAERERIRALAAERNATYPFYSEPGFITAHPPFADLIGPTP